MDREAKRKLYESMGYTESELAAAMRVDERVDRMRGCTVGTYPWDLWAERARAAGVPEKLANLGRELLREFYQHAWDDELADACGYTDEGAGALIDLALMRPEVAAERWRRLLDTDGFRGERGQGNTWIEWPLERRDRELAALRRNA